MVHSALIVMITFAMPHAVDVVSQAPIVDTQSNATATTISEEQLKNLPMGRDVGSLLSLVPGVLKDRVDVGGSEGGRNTRFVVPGTSAASGTFMVDGLNITDMSALGQTPNYFDFDSIKEVQVITGASGAQTGNPGAVFNIITRSGTNDWKKSVRFDAAPGALVGEVPADDNLRGGQAVKSITSYGATLGGPIIKDRLWFFVSGGGHHVGADVRTGNGSLDQLIDAGTRTNAVTGRVDYKLSNENHLNLLTNLNLLRRFGEGADYGKSLDATWKVGASPFNFRVQDTLNFGTKTTIRVTGGVATNGYTLTPLGGDVPSIETQLGFTKSFLQYDNGRRATEAKLDASNFFNTGSLSHELKFGAGYRNAAVSSEFSWPGGQFVDTTFTSPASPVVIFPIGYQVKTGLSYLSAYAQDTLTNGNLTLNLGLRYDHQGCDNKPSVLTANPFFPTLAPGATFAGSDCGISWTSLVPRTGLVYALGKDRKTLLRAAYSRYADQLSSGTASWLNPIGNMAYSYAYFGGGVVAQIDAGPDGIYTPGDHTGPFVDFGPPANSSPFFIPLNRITDGFRVPLTDEVLMGVEHALLPEFVVGLNLTYRSYHDVPGRVPLVKTATGTVRDVTVSDWVPAPPIVIPGQNGMSVSIPYSTLAPGLFTTGGYDLINQSSQSYLGVNLSFNKRLSNRWMLRGNFDFHDWTEHFDKPYSPNNYDGFFDNDKGLVAPPSTDPLLHDVHMNAKWAFRVDGLYQFPGGLNISGVYNARQGYPFQPFVRTSIGDITSPKLDDLGPLRLPTVQAFDVHVERAFKIQRSMLALDLDIFNITNAGTALAMPGQVISGTFGQVKQVIQPRIVRLGVRLEF